MSELTQGEKMTRTAAREAARDGSAYWRLGIPSSYKWRRNDPERADKIAAERAESATKRASAMRDNAHDGVCPRRWGKHRECSCGLVCTCERSS